jgi:hypothetical protein
LHDTDDRLVGLGRHDVLRHHHQLLHLCPCFLRLQWHRSAKQAVSFAAVTCRKKNSFFHACISRLHSAGFLSTPNQTDYRGI